MLVDPADVAYLLPARTRYEQEGGGTETTTERRVVLSPEIPGHRVGEARTEWRILEEVGARARPEMADRIRFADGAAIRREIAEVIPSYRGIERLRKGGDQFQWGGERLCEGGRFPTADGRARNRREHYRREHDKRNFHPQGHAGPLRSPDSSAFAVAATPALRRAKSALREIGLGEPDLEEDRREREHSYLIQHAEALRRPGGESVGFCNPLGPPGPEMCEEATRLSADLVVMATHGRGSFNRIWLGSVADYVVRHLSTPVLLVPPGSLDRPVRDLREILVGLDLSSESEAILEPVSDLARLTGAQLTLFHVVEVIYAIGKLSPAAPVVADSELLETSQAEAERGGEPTPSVIEASK